jgi:hypothetical protein
MLCWATADANTQYTIRNFRLIRFEKAMSYLSKKLCISQTSVRISVKRGERIAKTEQLELV